MAKPTSRIAGATSVATLLIIMVLLSSDRSVQAGSSSATFPTFYKDVLPILQQHCQVCHRAGEIAPMPLVTFAQAHGYAQKMKRMTSAKMMPPWFADSRFGHFSNDNSLTVEQIATIASWADSGAAAGNANDAPPAPQWAKGWNIPEPDLVIGMPAPVTIPAQGDVEYTY